MRAADIPTPQPARDPASSTPAPADGEAIVVIGDLRDTAGFRLAGLRVHCPAPGEVAAAVAQAAPRAALVVLSQWAARDLGEQALASLRQAERPLVAVLPDLAAPATDLVFLRRLRAVLGIEA